MLISKCLYEQGVRTEHNVIVENNIIDGMDYVLFQLIAVDEIDKNKDKLPFYDEFLKLEII